MANKNILQLNNIEDKLSLGDYFIVWDKEENISEPTKKVTLAELIDVFSGITSVNGKTNSEVILKTDDISSAGQNNKYVTQTEKDKISKIKTDQPSDTFLNGQGVYANIPVIDNLLTENQYLGLSANQGKILKDLNDSLFLLINNITNGVPEAGDSLLKLFNLISSNSSLIQDIYLILQSDEETLDTFQEIVDFIESNRDDLDNYVLQLQNKVDKETGKGLSSNDYTTTEKNKLENIEEEAQKNVQSDWNQSNNSADDYIKNKPSLFPPASHGHDISEVSGLSETLLEKVNTEEGKGLFAESDQEKVDAIDIDGDGTRFLTDDGTYKSELNPRTYIEESASGSVSIDLANKDIVHVEMSDNITSFNVTNPVVGKTYKIYMIQDSIGNRTLTGLDPKFKTENNIPILLSTDQNAVDLLQLDIFSETDIKIYPVYNI